jgi:hypothetical protein
MQSRTTNLVIKYKMLPYHVESIQCRFFDKMILWTKGPTMDNLRELATRQLNQ